MGEEMGARLSPKQSARLIVDGAKDVKISQEGVNKAAQEVFEALKSGKLSMKNFKQCGLHPKEVNDAAIDWIFLVDTLNFSFWTMAPKWEVSFEGVTHTGYFALCAAINRAMKEGIDITNPNVYGSMSEEELLKVFRSETGTPIPLIEDREKSMKEVANVLIEKYNGSFTNCVKAAEGSAEKLLKIIVENFPCFRDEVRVGEQTFSFLKRAQILVADIWACYEGKGMGEFHDIDSLTMFADYRIPQVLLYYGALNYSPELLALLEKDELMEYGCSEEVEIRGASILCVEEITNRVRDLISEACLDLEINSIMIDHFLWDLRRERADALEVYPYHKKRQFAKLLRV